MLKGTYNLYQAMLFSYPSPLDDIPTNWGHLDSNQGLLLRMVVDAEYSLINLFIVRIDL